MLKSTLSEANVTTTAAKLEVTVPSELLTRLQQRAQDDHKSVDELVVDLVAASFDDDEWNAQVQEGLDALDRGEGIPGEAVHAYWDARLKAVWASQDK